MCRVRVVITEDDPPASFGLDPELLDERPPFLDLGLLQCAERLWRLSLARENLQPEIGKPRSCQRSPNACTVAALSLAMMSFGVPLGANSAYKVEKESAGSPISPRAGMSGASAIRVSLAIA